jgi:lipoprotein-anchoring transpeptidase ErfK/SrfK
VNRKLILVISIACALSIIALVILRQNKGAPLLPKAGDQASSAELVIMAKDAEIKGNLLEALQLYQKLVSEFSGSRDVINWQKKAEDLNIKILFSPLITNKSILYEVKPGDTLTKIAKEFNTTIELIMKSNNLSSDKIVPGRKIKVWTAAFNIFVDKSQNTLILKSQDEFFKTYTVSTGANNSTPVGHFKIVNKLVDPPWFKAGAVVAPNSPENILGSRWLGLDVSGYGIHGTTEPQSLGRQVTQGCVRMANTEVEELYSIVAVGTEVVVVD